MTCEESKASANNWRLEEEEVLPNQWNIADFLGREGQCSVQTSGEWNITDYRNIKLQESRVL